jgi:hypothetical protein
MGRESSPASRITMPRAKATAPGHSPGQHDNQEQRTGDRVGAKVAAVDIDMQSLSLPFNLRVRALA